jgi:hypothetical protein
MMEHIKKHIEQPTPPAGAPGMFRCAQQGVLSSLFAAAGLKDVSEAEIPCELDCGGAQAYWDMMTEIAAPVVAALGTANEATVSAVKTDVLTSMHERHPDGAIDACGLLIVGVK